MSAGRHSHMVTAHPVGPLAPWVPPHPAPRQRAGAALFVAALCLLAAGCAAAYAWRAAAPEQWLQTRLIADGDPALAHPLLAAIALRYGTAPDASVALAEAGASLLVTGRGATQHSLRARLGALVDAIEAAPAMPAATAAPAPDLRAGLLARRSSLQSEATALDTSAKSDSASITALTRDLAASARDADARKLSRTTSEKGADALAALQIQRFQLLAKYQANYPAVLLLEAQIHGLKTFLAGEERRADTQSPKQFADTLLVGERERVHAELTRIEARRTALATEAATLDRALLAPATARTPPPPPPPAVVLVEAGTTAGHAPDNRLLLVAAISLAGTALAALALLLGRRPAPAWSPVAPQFALAGAAPTALTATPPVLMRLAGARAVRAE